MIDHLHGRHAMPENIGPVRRLWMMTLFGEPPAPAASTTSTYVCSSAAIQKRTSAVSAIDRQIARSAATLMSAPIVDARA